MLSVSRFDGGNSEWYIYGSSSHGRFAAKKPDTLITYSVALFEEDSIFHRTVRNKKYELKDHLGNVRVVFTDLKVPNAGNFDLDVIASNNYYPFGMMLPMRNYENNGHRYGFNGMERDDEVKGAGNSVDFGARMYDPRLGRFKSRDKLSNEYPNQSCYLFAGSNPISFIDVQGHFKLSAQAQEKYPRLTSILKTISEKVIKNERILNALAAWGNQPMDKVKESLRWGEGPEVKPSGLVNLFDEHGFLTETGTFGLTLTKPIPPTEQDLEEKRKYKIKPPSRVEKTNEFRIDDELLDVLENAIKTEDIEIATFAVIVTLLHEDVHVLDTWNGISGDNNVSNERLMEIPKGTIIEEGHEFEKDAFGTKTSLPEGKYMTLKEFIEPQLNKLPENRELIKTETKPE